MSATKNDFIKWFEDGIKQHMSYMIVVRHSNKEEHPVYTTSEDFEAKFNECQHHLVEEIYDLSLDKDKQLNEHRTWHPPK
jgi:hypothetical protein